MPTAEEIIAALEARPPGNQMLQTRMLGSQGVRDARDMQDAQAAAAQHLNEQYPMLRQRMMGSQGAHPADIEYQRMMNQMAPPQGARPSDFEFRMMQQMAPPPGMLGASPPVLPGSAEAWRMGNTNQSAQ